MTSRKMKMIYRNGKDQGSVDPSSIFASLIFPDASDDEEAKKKFVKLLNSRDMFLPKVISAIQSLIDIHISTSRLLAVLPRSKKGI